MKKINGTLIATFLLGLAVGAGTLFVFYRPAENKIDDIIVAPLEVRGERVNEDTFRYENEEYAFSLEYPNTLTVYEFNEGQESITIVFENRGKEEGFQIFVTPYGEDTISNERIAKDIPSGVMENPIEILLGKEKNIRALHFSSYAPIIGTSTEVWFLGNDYLYEVTTYSAYDTEIGKILSTLDFIK